MAYYEHITTLANNQMKCTLCEEIIQDHSRIIEAHIHDRKHRELYVEHLMTTNNIIICNAELFCNICNCGIEVSELLSHVREQSHQRNLAKVKEFVALDGDVMVLPEKISSHSVVHCIICDQDFEFTHDSVKDHIISAEHKRARAMVLQPLNGIFSVEDSDDFLWCKICQLYFDNYTELIFQHVQELNHAKTMAKIMRLIDGQDIEIENYLQDLKQDKAFCGKCRIEVPCNVDNLQSHIKGKKHKS